MKRAIVIGCPGAGKSTFARKLKDKTGLPLYYLDRIFHKPDRTTVTREEFDQELQTILQTDRWIIDGNYRRTLPLRFEACTDVFFWIFRWMSVWKELRHELVRSVKICLG